ncbi:MAG TPA: response regulator transcription factor [Spirochaetota bacterium]|nr:response regulator transcription factor [Spirochaetota bacterium]HPJ36354.1 response regulator transcription factor [Spirochaetota bacterium]
MNELVDNISIYIIEDELLICDILCDVIGSIKGCILAGGTTNGATALKDISEFQPDIVFADIKLNNENGFDLISRIKSQFPEIKIIILSGYCNKTLIGQAIKSGASGYLTKNLKIDYIEDAIKNVYHSASFYIPENVGYRIDEVLSDINLYPNQFLLTKREKEILILIANEFSTREIAEKLQISEKTVRNHKSHMMQKLDIKSDAGLVKYAYYMAFI